MHSEVQQNSVAAFLFEKTKEDFNPLYVDDIEDLESDYHLRQVINYLAQNKIEITYTHDESMDIKDSDKLINKGDKIKFDKFIFTIMSVDNKRIKRVRVYKKHNKKN